MKKAVLIIGVLFAVTFFVMQEVNAIDTNLAIETSIIDDSKNISIDTEKQLMCNENDHVVRIFNVSLLNLFTKYNNMQDVIKTEASTIQIIYRITTSDGAITYKTIKDGQTYKMVDDFYVDNKSLQAFNRYDEIIKNALPDVVVNNVYFLWSELNFSGTAIYYETNEGDFVYHFSSRTLGEDEYLFPVEKFCDVQKTVLNELSKSTEIMYGSYTIDISNVIDLSKYNINSDQFNLATSNASPRESSYTALLTAVSCGFLLLVTVVAFGSIHWYRKRRYNSSAVTSLCEP